jgi:hypothetical protein
MPLGNKPCAVATAFAFAFAAVAFAIAAGTLALTFVCAGFPIGTGAVVSRTIGTD